MSTSSPDDPILATSEIQVHNFLHFAAISILYWDQLVTIDLEVTYFWKRRKTFSSGLFFFNRYFSFFGNVSVTVLGFHNLSEQSCRKYNLYRQLLLVATQLFVSFLLTLRIYALFNRDRRILWGTSGTAAVLFIAVCWPLFGQKSSTAPVPGIGCHIALSRGSAIRLAAAWEALFAYDTLLFCLTLYKTYTRRYYDDSGIRIRVSAPLVSLVLRDGAIYFAVMALSTLANVMTFYFAGPFLRGGLSTFASGISVTMMSRLMLNLHQTASEGILTTPSHSFPTTTDGSTTIELDTLWTSEMSVPEPSRTLRRQESNFRSIPEVYIQEPESNDSHHDVVPRIWPPTPNTGQTSLTFVDADNS